MSVVFQDIDRSTDWQAPGFESSPEQRASWVDDMVLEGEGFISGQTAYRNLAVNMRLFEGIFNDKSRSTLSSNFLKYNIRKFVETLSDIREIGTLGSDAKQFKPYSDIANKLLKVIYTQAQYPRQLRKALQYAGVMGVGYLWPKCKAQDYGFGDREIVFEALGLLDVLPVQVPSTNDVQDAYVNTIYEYMPIAEAHGRFPLFQALLKPINRSNYPSRLSAKRLDWAEKFRYGDQTRNFGNLYCEIRYTFVRDLRINNTGHELPMGDPDTTWFYKVPSIGQMIFGGIRNGSPYMRPAIVQDCRVYPQLRLIITANGINRPMYDGPAFDWHGKMPAVQYVVDDWPWESMGLSLVDTVRSIEATKRKHERLVDQVLSARLNPPMGYNRDETGGPKIEQFDLFEPNVRMGVNGEPRKTFQSVLPEEVIVTEANMLFLDRLGQQEEQQLGINDISSIMNLRLNVGSDGFDKILESIGPIAKGIAASLEASNAKIAYMLKFMELQWITAKMTVELLGPDNLTPEIFDFDPESLVPSHLEDEYVNGFLPSTTLEGVYHENGEPKEIPTPSQYDKLTRAKIFAKNLRLISVPSTLLKITQMQEQLKYLQLYRDGFPISPHTVAKKLSIENFGDIPGDTEFEKWVNWQKLKLLLMAEAQQFGAELGLMPDGTPQQPAQPGRHPGGRPPSGHAAPKIVQKDKNTAAPRTTVTESR